MIVMEESFSILIVGNFLSESTGARSVCEDLAERFIRAGWSVITTSSQPGRVARLCKMLYTVWSQRHCYKIASVDVYSGPSFIWAEMVCLALRMLGKPYVLSLHGGNLPVFAERWPGRVTRLLRSSSKVTVPSGYLLEKMKKYRLDIVLIPNPIDIGKYDAKIRYPVRPSLVWLRAFHEIYNPTLAIRTAALLIQEFPDLKLLMIGGDKGDGSLQETRKEADHLGIIDYVEFPGKISHDQVPSWLQRGDVFINTTNVDNTPVSILEAMACGLCIVSTDVGGIPYLLEDGMDALLVPPDDSKAMCAAVKSILGNPEMAEKLSHNARHKAEQFDWSTVLPMWESLFQEAIA